MENHGERKHSKYSASGAERWFNCSGSVELSEGLPDKDSKYSLEGTHGHEILEQLMLIGKEHGARALDLASVFAMNAPREMILHGRKTAKFILRLHEKTPMSEVLVETRVYLTFIHPEMFGTFDGAVIDHFGTLHVFDYKYGKGHSVSPKNNLQMIFYGIGLAHKYHWNFKRVRLYIDQPRVRGYDGPIFWEITIEELRRFIPLFEKAVERVETQPKTYVEGSWCFFCKAKAICPIKNKDRVAKAKSVFAPVKRRTNNV